MISTSSSPIFRQVVHFPPIKLSSPLSDSSITWFLDIFLVQLEASSTTKGRRPHHLTFSEFMNSSMFISLMISNKVLLMNFLQSPVQVGLFVGSYSLCSVVPAITRLSQGTTRIILPSGLGAQMPKSGLETLLSQVMWLPATMHILFLASGLSSNLILSDQAPVQFTTYLALTLYSFWVIASLKVTPVILPVESFTKLINQARLRALAGLKHSGMLKPLPIVAVSNAVSSSLASLKEPSSQTTPIVYLGFMWGKIQVSSRRFMKQGMLKLVGVEGEQSAQIKQQNSDPMQQQVAETRFVQGITKGIFVVRWGAESIIILLSAIASLTSWNFSILEEMESSDSSKTC